jgi:hypothetical protein
MLLSSKVYFTYYHFTILFSLEHFHKFMSSSSTKRQQENSNIQQQNEATIRSIDETKDNIRKAVAEARKETPRYSQTVTDFQNETADATQEIADNFLDSQKEVINSMQSAWTPIVQRTGYNWATGMMGVPFYSRELADSYVRTIGVMTEAYVASTRMATNVLFAGIEAFRATTNYTRQNAKEAARITSNTARTFAQTAKETVQVEGEQAGSSASGVSSSSFGSVGGSAASSFEYRGRAATTTTRHTSEGTAASSGETGSTTAGTGTLSDTVPGVTDKTRKK